MTIILTCNAGSSNVKLAAFDADTRERKGHAILHHTPAAMAEWLCAIGSLGIAAIGHRVVHGGRDFIHPTKINERMLDTLKQYTPLAPLHQPAALQLIEETRKLYPGVPQIACFDTAFHHTLPDIERLLPLPRDYYAKGIERYGFHGLSYQYIAQKLPEYTHAQQKIIVAHLGSGASACAMDNLKSIATTMGFSTLDGLMMSTRTGALDPGVIFHLQTELGMKPQEVEQLLYTQSGLLGVSGISGDMKELLASNAPAAQEAVALYCYTAAKHIAGLIPALGGLDALVFTGGIGENAGPVRERITALLRWIGDFAVHVIPTDEEAVIAQACQGFLKPH